MQIDAGISEVSVVTFYGAALGPLPERGCSHSGRNSSEAF